MPLIIDCVRHAQGMHNALTDWSIHDPNLTTLGLSQCMDLQRRYTHAKDVAAIFSSPSKRTIVTGALSFAQVFNKPKPLQITLMSDLQEIEAEQCNRGTPIPDLQKEFGTRIQVISSYVPSSWGSNKSAKDVEVKTIEARALKARRDIRAFGQKLVTKANPSPRIVVVSHSGYLEHFTETHGWGNAELRSFVFTDASFKDAQARLTETKAA
ncbi:phosphoglycerate mutase-like protein [Hypoxylon fuscum]|nr:phosphoglycerate mutase-like protein [Hypoxylon fuscum]